MSNELKPVDVSDVTLFKLKTHLNAKFSSEINNIKLASKPQDKSKVVDNPDDEKSESVIEQKESNIGKDALEDEM